MKEIEFKEFEIKKDSPMELVKRYNQRIHEEGMSSVDSMRKMNEERDELVKQGKWNPNMDYTLLYPEVLSPSVLSAMGIKHKNAKK